MEQCDWRFHLVNGVCQHYLLPASIETVIGSVLICLAAGLSSIAGLGGGGTFLIILLLAFNYTSKDATMVVFPCIVGATMGNILNQMRKSLNGEPLIQYHYAFVSIPIMFTGSFIGVLMNKVLPSIAICSFICLMTGISGKKIYIKFIESYQKETQQNLLNGDDRKQLIQETHFNPLSVQRNQYIFKNLGKLLLVYLALQIIRGSEKFPSIIGVSPCSFGYWTLYGLSFLFVGFYSYSNMKTLKLWYAPPTPNLQQGQPLGSCQNQVEKHLPSVIGYSIMAGVFSGFGLGGGLFLVPMYRSLGCSPLQATSSTAFGIFVTAVINCSQGVFLGVIKIPDLVYLFLISCAGSFVVSRLITRQLQNMNRLSVVEGILLLLIINAFINIPYSLWTRYVRSGYDSQELFGFGSPC